MLGKFFKPKWQHTDASVRIKSLSTLGGDSVELIKIAQGDPLLGLCLRRVVLQQLNKMLQLRIPWTGGLLLRRVVSWRERQQIMACIKRITIIIMVGVILEKMTVLIARKKIMEVGVV